MTDTPPPTFTHFGRLPLELRDMIWKLSTCETRVIHVQIVCLQPDPKPKPKPKRKWLGKTKRRNRQKVILPRTGFRYISPSSVPAILHVNAEARKIALEIYKEVFQGQEKDKTTSIFIQDDRDIVIIAGPKLSEIEHLSCYATASRMEGYFRRWMGKQPTCDVKVAVISRSKRAQATIVISSDKLESWKEKAYAALVRLGYDAGEQTLKQRDLREYAVNLEARTWKDAFYVALSVFMRRAQHDF